MVHFLRNGCSLKERSNIIFVCGGNKPTAIRQQFLDYCSKNFKEIEPFRPEDAMPNVALSASVKKFNIAHFEELIGELAHAIVIFPEAAGSFAEVGYFSKTKLAEKVILASNFKYHAKESFISLGPAQIYNDKSKFRGYIQLNYNLRNKSKKFEAVIEAIQKITLKSRLKPLTLKTFSSLTAYDQMCLIYGLFDFLQLATFEDIISLLHSIFNGQFSKDKVQKIISILYGSKYIFEVGKFGHYRIDKEKAKLLEPLNGFKAEATRIRLEISAINASASSDFSELIGGMSHAI